MNAAALTKTATTAQRPPLLLALCGIIMISLAVPSHAAVCFATPELAYAYLQAQDQAKSQAQKQAPININRASEAELVSLEGIGSTKAQAIILYREMFGDFDSIEALTNVKGIGEKTVEKNRARLRVDP